MEEDNLIYEMYMRQLQSGQTYQTGGKFCTSGSPFILASNPNYNGGQGEWQKFLKDNKNSGLNLNGLRCRYFDSGSNKNPPPKKFNKAQCIEENTKAKPKKQKQGNQPNKLKAYTDFAKEIRNSNPNKKFTAKDISCLWHQQNGTEPPKKNKKICENIRFDDEDENAIIIHPDNLIPRPIDEKARNVEIMKLVFNEENRQLVKDIGKQKFYEMIKQRFPSLSKNEFECLYKKLIGGKLSEKQLRYCTKYGLI